jgi:transcriptional regulator with XRE-family HTH domain
MESFMSELFSFGAWVRQRRRALDLTRDELATQVGCSIVTIRHIEADERRPSKQLAARLADGLQISSEERPAFLQAARGELATDRLAVPGAGMERHIAGTVARTERDTSVFALASGTVTFLFTDIEGSTQLWAQNPQIMGPAIARHEAILRTVITASSGVVFKIVEDAIYAAFVSTLDAVLAAVEGQHAIAAEPWIPAPRCVCAWRCSAGWSRSTTATILGCRLAASRTCWLPATAARSCSRRPRWSWRASSFRLR